ncbi:MAG: hypothetical protein KF884_04745 [Fimbriimonadaceae bacterium]|nr:hypothetical protein [Fimbriimonadaceae bacterium]QYK59396.1 MAG: hypothetical protein KF884_04745 [Fimbriimonadaceae bacterium]
MTYFALTSIALLGATGPVGLDLRLADIVELEGKDHVRIEGRVNEFHFGSQSNPALAVRPDGSFAVAWESRRQRNGLSGVYLRTFDQLGRPMSTETPTTSDKGSPQSSPTVAWTGDKPVAAYEARFRDDQRMGVYVGDSMLNQPTKGLKFQPVSASSSDGKVAMVWLAEVGHLKNRVFARILDGKGKPLSAPVVLSENAGGSDANPSVAFDGRDFVAVWQRFDGENKSHGLVARKFSVAGSKLGQQVKVAGDSAIEPNLARVGNGLVLAWTQYVGNRFAVRAAQLDASLTRKAHTVEATGQSGDQNAVAVAGREDGSFVLAWNNATPKGSNVFAQSFGPDGRPTAPAFRVTRYEDGDQKLNHINGSSQMAFDDNGLTVVWSGNGGPSDNSGVYFTRIVESGAAARAELRALADRPEPIAAPVLDSPMELKLDKSIVDTTARPHEPPISDMKGIVNEWGVQIPMIGGGFNGYSQTSFTPPDTNIAVGPDWLVVVVNDGIAFFDKNGNRTFIANQRFTDGFWGALAAPDNFIYDPECFYDHLTGRFWVMSTQGAGSGTDSAALVAVSDDSDPNGTWYKYRFLTTSLAGNFFDSPNFGVDANVLYVTGDGFGMGSNYPVFCIEKAPLLSGGTPSVIRSAALPTSTQSAGIPPVQDSGSVYYMVEHKEATNNTAVDIVALSNPLTTGPTFQRFTLTVPSYGRPENPPSGGTSNRITAFDARFWSVKYRNGFLWATHHVDSSKVVAAWYQIDPRGWPNSGLNPVLVQSGKVDLSSTIRTHFSAIAADDANNVSVAYARSSPSEFLSSARSSRVANDPLNTLPTSAIDKANTGAYTGTRWGDYHGVEADPKYPGMFWSFVEWAEGQSWRAWVQPYRVSNKLWFTEFNTQFGQRVGGVFKDTIIEDNVDLVHRGFLRLQPTDPFIAWEGRTYTHPNNPTTASIELVYRVDASGYRIEQRLLNRTTNQFDLVDSRIASPTKTTLTTNITNPANYVRQSDGQIVYRVSIVPNNTPTSSANPQLFVDRLSFVVN